MWTHPGPSNANAMTAQKTSMSMATGIKAVWYAFFEELPDEPAGLLD